MSTRLEQEQVRIHGMTARTLCHLHPGQRLQADRALLLIRPEPLLLSFHTRHDVPQDGHSRSWTLSTTADLHQSGHSRRIPRTFIVPASLLERTRALPNVTIQKTSGMPPKMPPHRREKRYTCKKAKSMLGLLPVTGCGTTMKELLGVSKRQ